MGGGGNRQGQGEEIVGLMAFIEGGAGKHQTVKLL